MVPLKYCEEYMDENFTYGDSLAVMNSTLKKFPSYPTTDIIIGVLLVVIGTLGSLLNMYLVVVFSQRHKVGVTNLLIQIASIDFISGILALVMAKNMIMTKNIEAYKSHVFLNIMLCQIPGILYQVFSVALPMMLMYLTIWRLVAVTKPHKYGIYLVQYRRINCIAIVMAWLFGLAAGLMPYLLGKTMCYMREWAFCDYRIGVLIKEKALKHVAIGLLTMLPTLPSYFVIVCGSLIVSLKLTKQRSTREESSPVNSVTQSPRCSIQSNKTENKTPNISGMHLQRGSLKLFEISHLSDREKSVVVSTLIMALSFFITNFPWVAYVLIYIGKADKNTFIILSGGNKMVEMYMYNWYYSAHALSGLVNAIAQVTCCKELADPILKVCMTCRGFIRGQYGARKHKRTAHQ